MNYCCLKLITYIFPIHSFFAIHRITWTIVDRFPMDGKIRTMKINNRTNWIFGHESCNLLLFYSCYEFRASSSSVEQSETRFETLYHLFYRTATPQSEHYLPLTLRGSVNSNDCWDWKLELNVFFFVLSLIIDSIRGHGLTNTKSRGNTVDIQSMN